MHESDRYCGGFCSYCNKLDHCDHDFCPIEAEAKFNELKVQVKARINDWYEDQVNYGANREQTAPEQAFNALEDARVSNLMQKYVYPPVDHPNSDTPLTPHQTYSASIVSMCSKAEGYVLSDADAQEYARRFI